MRLAVGVLKLKNAVQLAAIAAGPDAGDDAGLVALGEAGGVGDVFELEGVPPLLQAAAITATAAAPSIFRACL